MPETPKKVEREQVWNRIRAHLRAAMRENGLGLIAAADLLHEDKGALSAYLKGRAPSAYLVYRIQKIFDVSAEALLNEDPAPEFFRPGIPDAPRRRYTIKGDAPPGPTEASRDADARPGKRHHS